MAVETKEKENAWGIRSFQKTEGISLLENERNQHVPFWETVRRTKATSSLFTIGTFFLFSSQITGNHGSGAKKKLICYSG